ncbi:DUF6252 family protein [Pontibacter sp. E15-1]|uniref:DUF6252 family protein n=1 Tax=Pontibacter sp. E15-1 TaxID=2919918 RepID=UPI001F4F6D94|nr:DUF6252 family protein [Pontibacter sp. E15-1]MCJ8166446.1 DUF6252 family protein [Pontibacter sp. E15-1]
MKAKLSVFLLLFFLLSCSKDNLCRNEAFCVEVNGKKWWPKSNDFKSSPLTFHLLDDNNQFWIGAYNGSSSVLVGVIDHTRGIGVGDYVLAGQTCCSGSYTREHNINFKTDASHTGKLTITSLDRVKKTVAGTFYFRGRNSVTGETVEVTKGSFNSKYSEY